MLYSHKFKTKLTKTQIETTLSCTAKRYKVFPEADLSKKNPIVYRVKKNRLIIYGASWDGLFPTDVRFSATIKEIEDGCIIKGIFGSSFFDLKYILSLVFILTLSGMPLLKALMTTAFVAAFFEIVFLFTSYLGTASENVVIDYINSTIVR